MSEKGELKPKSFRIDDETAEKFKEISANIGGNQQETMAKLIEAYEFQSGKEILTEKRADIEQFECYINLITRMYMSSLEDNQNVTEIVRTQFEAMLQSKDAVIKNLQEQLESSKQISEKSISDAKFYEQENTSLKDQLNKTKEKSREDLRIMQDMLTDKENLNLALSESCENLKRKVNELNEDLQTSLTIKKQLEEIKNQLKTEIQNKTELEQALKESKREIESLKQRQEEMLEFEKKQAQIILQEKLLETETNYQKQIEDTRNAYLEKIERLQEKIMTGNTPNEHKV